MAFGNDASNAIDSGGTNSNLSSFNASAGSLAHENLDSFGKEANQNRLNDRNRKKRKKKKGAVDDEIDDPRQLSSTVKLRLATTDARTMPFTQWVMNLKGPSKWCSEKEQRAFYEFGYGSAAVNDAMKKRFHKAILTFIVFMVVTYIFSPSLIKHISITQRLPLALAAGIVCALLSWLFAVRASMRAYTNMIYERQLVFIQFERLLIPYLSEMKNGVSLFSMLKRVARRLPNEGDQILVQRLMSALGEGTTSSAPFVDFARRFGGSDSARLFMMSIYQMYSGNYNDSVVRNLGEQSNQQMMSQVDMIITRKLKRFNSLTTWLTMGIMLIIIGYLGMVMVDTFSRALKMMPN